MSGYIIKNCEQIHSSDNFCWSKNVLCQDCTDCVLKQIVELCKENLNSLEAYVDVRSFECAMLQNILQLLDIQEVE